MGLTHLSLHPVHSVDGKTVYWRCTATPSTMHKYVHVTTNDPVEAVSQVLKAMPKAPKRKAVTATVTDPEPDAPAQAPQLQPESELEAWLPKT
jgi:hypothetical protein